MTAAITRSGQIKLGKGLTDRARNLSTGTVQTWAAGSADGVWWFQRIDLPGTPWEITHLPTGLTLYAGDEKTARRMAADPATLAVLRERSQKVVDSGGRPAGMVLPSIAGRPVMTGEPAERTAARYGLALRAVHILDRLLVAAPVDGLCTCGRFLTGDRHADMCRECYGGTLEEVRACRLLHEHRACDDLEVQLCGHAACVTPARPAGAADCERGLDVCCGCCLGR